MKQLVGSFLLAVSVLATAASQAESYSVSLTKQVTESQSVYLAQDLNSGELTLTSSRQVTNTVITGEGPLAQLNQRKEGEVDEAVIGMDINGHSKLSLALANGELFVIIDVLVDDTISGVPIRLPVKMSVPAQFRKGTWDGYLAGEEVEIEYTGQGRELAHEALVAKTKYLMRVVSKALKDQIRDAEFSEVRVDAFRVEGEATIRGTKNRLEVEGAAVTIQVSFDITL